MSNKTIVEKIGVPSVLEACAEECNELAQICLKLARKLRNENPTPKSEKELVNSLEEELGDVLVCMNTIIDEAKLVTSDTIYEIADFKLDRWHKRIDESLSTTKSGSVDKGYITTGDLPKVNKDVLIKLKNPAVFESRKYIYTVGYYAEDGSWWTADNDELIPLHLIVGWKEIEE